MADIARRPEVPGSVPGVRDIDERSGAASRLGSRTMVDDPASVPVKASATVLVLRSAPHRPTGPDATDRHEVLLLRRNDRSGFVAGVHLYPGGAVDDSDGEIPLSGGQARGTPVRRGTTGKGGLEGAFERGAIEHGALEHGALEHGATRQGGAEGAIEHGALDRLAIAAAARECFEEAGILLAHTAESQWADAAHVAEFGPEEPFSESLRRLGLTVPVHRFVPWGRWVTPMGAPRRYDTRFFAVEVPTAAIRVDGREIVHGAWWDPATALAAERAGELRFVTPTRKTLERLVGHRWTTPGES